MNERLRELAVQADLIRYPSDGINIKIEKFAELVRADEREWVGLSGDEREHFRKLGFVGVLAVENKLKEKNT